MLDKACVMNRRNLGLLRIAAILAGFACVIHVTHRECARNADKPDQIAFGIATSRTEAKGAMDFHATAYCVTGLTKSGVPAAPGYVSADPRVIPLGSVIYVETPFRSGVYQVMDTGELIKGKIIDIFIPSYEACKEFGRRMVKVKVLRYGFRGDPARQNPAT
jgi:3D (Asp-Asp-Asp) domain-containing protein